jgi:hypothetical protein
VLFFQGQWYALGDLVPGESREVAPLFERGGKPHGLADWFNDSSVLEPRPGARPTEQRRSWPGLGSRQIVRELMFYGAPGGGRQSNSGLRRLDEGWRLFTQGEGGQRRFRDEAILVARTPPRHDRTESVTADNASPSRLLLDDPSGYLQQETYVRIYIPLVRTP